MPTKVYIAASWPRKDEAHQIASLLRSRGHEVTSTWHEVPHPQEPTEERCREWADRDLRELNECEVLICLTGDDRSVGGGRHSEVGAAIGTLKPVFLLGPREKNVFHWHFMVTLVTESIDEILSALE